MAFFIFLWLLSGILGFLLFVRASDWYSFDGDVSDFGLGLVLTFLGAVTFIAFGIPSIMSIVYNKYKH